jgi:heme exporter protein A
MQPSAPRLSVEGLALSRGGTRLFADVSLVLDAGDLLLLRGPNGAGKSSLLLALAGLLRPDAGAIRWAGGEAPALHLLAHLSAVKTRLTLAENLSFWVAVNGRAGLAPEPALARVGLGGLADIAAGHLSAGQTRRLALARLLVSDRPIWLLDEPLAALDSPGAALVEAQIAERLASGGAVIAATHDDIAGASQTLMLGRAALNA